MVYLGRHLTNLMQFARWDHCMIEIYFHEETLAPLELHKFREPSSLAYEAFLNATRLGRDTKYRKNRYSDLVTKKGTH